ncbi:unnamed protein product [Effrenium voratum]|nr:unnamed protein product [Effrenium voratum]
MLVEAFKQRQDPEPIESPVKEEPPKKRGLSWVTRPGKQKPVVEASPNPRGQEDAEAIAMASRLTQFFALLPKHPGKHGAPMLSLALESVAESGLWRRGVLLPHNEDGQTRWLRNFSWPELFSFVHERLPTEMRFRLWRCSLQICVSSPALAPLAEIPFALASVAADAPPGASELLQEALDLGADPESLGPLCARLPPQKEAKLKEREPKLLLSPADGINAERERRAELASLGINIEVWAPSDLEVSTERWDRLQFKKMFTSGCNEAPEQPAGEESCAAAAQKLREADVLLFRPSGGAERRSRKAEPRARRINGAGFSADSGLAVYADVAKVPAYAKRDLEYHDICKTHWLFDEPELFWGFWGQCFNDYRLTDPHLGYEMVHHWVETLFRRTEVSQTLQERLHEAPEETQTTTVHTL